MLMQALGGSPRRFPPPATAHLLGASVPPEKIRIAQAGFGSVLASNCGLTKRPNPLTPGEAVVEENLASVGTVERREVRELARQSDGNADCQRQAGARDGGSRPKA